MVVHGGLCMFELEYIGSYFAKKIEEHTKAEFVRKQIHSIQKKSSGSARKVPVLFTISAGGVKVTDRRGQVVLLANSLHQITYCSYLKEDRIFCFLSRESSRYEEIHQYVHIFTSLYAEVDELNSNILNAFNSANASGTITPNSTNASSSKPRRAESCKLTKDTDQIKKATSSKSAGSDPLNLSRSFNGLSLSTNLAVTRTVSLSSPTSSSSDRRQQNTASSSNYSSDEQTVRKAMLKHTISAQAKLESSRSKHVNPFRESLSRTKSAQSGRSKLGRERSVTAPPSTAKQSDQANTQKLSKSKVKNVLSAPTTGSPSLPTSPASETYATVNRKFNSPRVVITPFVTAVNANLAYLNDDEGANDSPPLPESIYSRLPLANSSNQHGSMLGSHPDRSTAESSTNSTALPPPTAFLDSESDRREPSYSDVFKDYMDIEKSSVNNNNSDTFSFYSDNYVKAATLGCRSGSNNSLRPVPNNLNRSEPLRQSQYSCGSSGMSVNSFEGEQMVGRPLPLTPPTEEHGLRANTPLRYQNDSPFVSSSTNRNTFSNESRSLSRSTSGHSANQSAEEKQKSTEELLKQVPWFQPKLNRDEVLQRLSREELGSFIIRESSTHTSCFALSVKVPKFNNPSGIAHYIIHRTPSQGFRIKGLEKEWTNLSSLVVHHTIMPELLPCTLKVPPPISSRRMSTASRSSNSSRASSTCSPSPSTSSKPSTPSQLDRIAHNLDKKQTVHEVV